MDNCVFCMIAEGKIGCKKVYEDDTVIAFHDIEPQAPVHVLVIPKRHTQSILTADKELMGHMLDVCAKLSKELEIDESGFRVVMNTGEHGNQSVPHLHMHILGGRSMQWPPG
ncbi:MAG: histidine triad nucleotide-binding protein [Eubacteriales bacterium]|nr:histidine triad nucleotide-binding protein [Eubacteriales bacterium]MCI7570195.1 histidine triad nucleotide-binding protein [Clostridiales bacterium]MDD7551456.1 histidine triad nucleotide-binding protein [Clostridia bacterium]MDY5753720.1 histidine triad nucleotide-binding protein [Eubacteriales bacterium]